MQARPLVPQPFLQTQFNRGSCALHQRRSITTWRQQQTGRRGIHPGRTVFRRGQPQITALRNFSGHDVPVSSPIINEKGIVVGGQPFRPSCSGPKAFAGNQQLFPKTIYTPKPHDCTLSACAASNPSKRHSGKTHLDSYDHVAWCMLCVQVDAAEKTPFKKILCANRGEIAVRVFRAGTELGLRTVSTLFRLPKMAAKSVLLL